MISKWITVNIGLNGKFCCICNLIDNGFEKMLNRANKGCTNSGNFKLNVKYCSEDVFSVSFYQVLSISLYQVSQTRMAPNYILRRIEKLS